MKYISKIAFAATLLALVGCNKFLDTLPDNRTELDSENKVASILSSAYPNHLTLLIQELGTDNVIDNGANYNYNEIQQQIFFWQDINITSGNDNPKSVWSNHYEAVANANQALQAIKELGNPESLNPQRGEALLCRAYAIFCLANAFCMPYNPTTAQTDLGLPYPTEPETQLVVKWTRGNMADLYKQLNDDIDEALPLISDDAYKVPKYHFNKKAAYAFGAKFKLYYQDYPKAIEYATVAIGEDPSAVLRNFAEINPLGAADIANHYVAASNPANLMLQTAYSTASRVQSSSSWRRYAQGRDIVTYETFWAKAPWGSSSTNNVLHYSRKLYGAGNQQIRFPRLSEFFEYTDKVAGTGYAHIVNVPFTTDLTLLVRAEAEALSKDYTGALKDLNYWTQSHCAATAGTAVRPVFTEDYVNTYVNSLAYTPDTLKSNINRTIRKKFVPQGFVVEAGTQENLLQIILQCQRLETVAIGERWEVIKRYGIQITHMRDGEKSLILTPGDKRCAIQLPQDVISAGLEPNPRDN